MVTRDHRGYPTTCVTFSGPERSFYHSPSGNHQTWRRPSPGTVQPFPALLPLQLLGFPASESHLSLLRWHTEINPKRQPCDSLQISTQLGLFKVLVPFWLLLPL